MSNDPELLEPIEEDTDAEETTEPADVSEEPSLDAAPEKSYYESGTDFDPVLDPGKAARKNTRRSSNSPALTISIASWATPIVGLVMLALGLAGGFFLRPVLLPVQTAAVTPAVETAANPTSAPSEQTAAQPQQPSSSDREALMGAIAPQVRHFKGNPDAPITLIEFSDFQ